MNRRLFTSLLAGGPFAVLLAGGSADPAEISRVFQWSHRFDVPATLRLELLDGTAEQRKAALRTLLYNLPTNYEVTFDGGMVTIPVRIADVQRHVGYHVVFPLQRELDMPEANYVLLSGRSVWGGPISAFDGPKALRDAHAQLADMIRTLLAAGQSLNGRIRLVG